MAGMSIAFATVCMTIFVGFLVRGKYDDVEKSFFEAQDEVVRDDKEKQEKVGTSQVVSDFFGDVNPLDNEQSS